MLATDLEERSVLDKLGKEVASFAKCDVRDPVQCAQAVKTRIERYGCLDILFHNAGHWPKLSCVEDIGVKLFQDVINVDLNSLFYFACAAIPAMNQYGNGGSIITTASNSGLAGDAGNSSYAAAKAVSVDCTSALAPAPIT